MEITCERNVQGTDITSYRNEMETFTASRGMYGGRKLHLRGIHRGQTLQVKGMYSGQTLQVRGVHS